MTKTKVKRYSQAFRQQVVREYEQGASVNSLRKKYAIGNFGTIKRWIERYASEGYRSEVVLIQSVADQEDHQALQARVSQLEAALAEQVLENRMLRTTLEVASAELGLDLKKNIAKRSSSKP